MPAFSQRLRSVKQTGVNNDAVSRGFFCPVEVVEPGGIRLSVGLEDWHDIINDLEIALEQI